MKIGSKVKVIGADESEGTLIRYDPDGMAIIETKKRVIVCRVQEVILIK